MHWWSGRLDSRFLHVNAPTNHCCICKEFISDRVCAISISPGHVQRNTLYVTRDFLVAFARYKISIDFLENLLSLRVSISPMILANPQVISNIKYAIIMAIISILTFMTQNKITCLHLDYSPSDRHILDHFCNDLFWFVLNCKYFFVLNCNCTFSAKL